MASLFAVYTFSRRWADASVGKGRVVPGGHITQVAGDVHGLVIADERDDLAVGAQRFALQPHEVLDNLERVRAAVDDVAGLHQDSVPADPAAFTVNQSRGASNVSPGSEVAVQVANRNNAMHGGCSCHCGYGQNQDRQKTTKARPKSPQSDLLLRSNPE